MHKSSVKTLLISATALVAGKATVAADYVNPYSAEGKRAAAPALGDEWLWIVTGLLSLTVLILVMVVMLRMRINQYLAQEQVAKHGEQAVKNHSTWWELFVKKERERPLDAPIEGHNYDGIVELDNNPPAWFNWLFFLPIVWGFGYILYFHVLEVGELQEEEYATEVKAAEIAQKARDEARASDLANLEPLTETPDIAEGKTVYLNNCAACHKENGGGGVGPNLTDHHWKNGAAFSAVFNTIYNGVEGTGMIAWKEKLKFKEVQQVASYVHAQLRGNQVEDGKDPEGQLYEEYQ